MGPFFNSLPDGAVSLSNGLSNRFSNRFSNSLCNGGAAACAAAVRPITKIKQKDIMLNPILMDKCRNDMKKLQCMPPPGKGMKKNKLLECLIDQIDKVQAKGCREAIGRKVDQRAADASLDPNIAAYCPRDVEKYCQGVEPEAMHDCLFKNLKKLSPKCAEAEFKGEKAIAKLEDQVGVDMLTRKACIAVRTAVCKEIPWDQGADARAQLAAPGGPLAPGGGWEPDPTQEAAVLQYNDPFQPPWKRRNEVALPLRRVVVGEAAAPVPRAEVTAVADWGAAPASITVVADW